MQNYHRHSCYSNIFTPDSAEFNETYAKRAVELGHKIISSVEHGFQGYYFQTFELAKKYNLKCVIGAEAYWVKDRQKEYPTNTTNKNGEEILQKDKSNHHIILLAKNNKGREALNDILSEASITGYYYKPRVDLELLLSLPADDIFCTSACIAFSGYEDIDDIILQLKEHFKENFMLEIQYHNTDKQKEWNKHLLDLHNKYNIELIVGLDSHYVYPEGAKLRDIYIDYKGITYEDEEGWYMDYPDDETVMNRFLEQGIFTKEQIQKAMDNTDICLTFDDYDNVPIFSKEIKLPTLYPNETKEQKDKRYSKLMTKKFKEYMKNIPTNRYDEYFEGVKAEIQTYKDTGMVDYPLLDYAIVQDAIEHGCLITDTGRGSAVGYITNSFSGFSSVDRFKSAIKLYPERFISTTRILETKSLPDIDLNTGTPEILEASQVRILGEDHAVPMIAFGTLKKKSAFKIYAKVKGLDFQLANEISNQIGKYDEALKYAEDEEDKKNINVFDYIDSKYHPYVKQSEKYWGVISDKKKAPSAYLLYQGSIRKEIGLIKCKSESTNKEYITCVIDGTIAENYKFLKNDILKVDVVLLIDKVFNRIGIEHFDVNTLIDKVTGDKKVWDLYANGYTIGLNQVEQNGSKQKCMNYKPTNISELSAFVAAIRPGFKSMYKKFEQREDFSWGIPSLDHLLRTEELPVSFLFFQEQVMSVLNYAGFPMDTCYGIIKAIAKKHPEKVRPLKQKFIDGFKNKIIQDENLDESTALEYAKQVWVIINDNCGYSFNSSHAYCMALDSLYQAWQKAHYPYEFYEVLLQHYADKGNKDKVVALKQEMLTAFGISEGEYKFGKDNRKFVADESNHCIYPALSSIKGISQTVANKLYSIKDEQFTSFYDLLLRLKNIGITAGHIDILIKIGYFSDFGNINELLKEVEIIDKFYGRSQISKDDIDKFGIDYSIIMKYSTETKKLYKITDSSGLINDIKKSIKVKTSICDRIKYQLEFLGYTDIIVPKTDEKNYYVIDINSNWLTLYQLKTGTTIKIKTRANVLSNNPVQKDDVIKVFEVKREPRYYKDANGKWAQDHDNLEDILRRYQVLKK